MTMVLAHPIEPDQIDSNICGVNLVRYEQYWQAINRQDKNTVEICR